MILMHSMFLLCSLQTCKSSETYRGGKRIKPQISFGSVHDDDVLVFHSLYTEVIHSHYDTFIILTVIVLRRPWKLSSKVELGQMRRSLAPTLSEMHYSFLFPTPHKKSLKLKHRFISVVTVRRTSSARQLSLQQVCVSVWHRTHTPCLCTEHPLSTSASTGDYVRRPALTCGRATEREGSAVGYRRGYYLTPPRLSP